MGNIALGREEIVFVVPETTIGTLAEPQSTHVVYITGEGSISGGRTLLDNKEKRNSRTRFKPIGEKFAPGDWTFPTYLKPSGTAGTEPETKDLWTAAFGGHTSRTATTCKAGCATNTIIVNSTSAIATNTAVLVNNEVAWITSKNASTASISPSLASAPANTDAVGASENYHLCASNPGTVSLWIKKGHTVFALSGCPVNIPEMSIPGEGVAEVTWSGQYMARVHTGTDTLASAIADSSVTHLHVSSSAHRFMKGSIFKIDDEYFKVVTTLSTSASATVAGLSRGYSPGGDTGTATAHAQNANIIPWVPSSYSSALGTAQPGYLGRMKIGGTAIDVLTCTITPDMGAKIVTGEKNNSMYSTEITTPNLREIKGTITCLFRKDQTKYFSHSLNITTNEVVIPGGDQTSAGNIFSVQLKNCVLETPELAGDEEQIATINFTAFGEKSKNNDEIRVAFL